MFDRNHDECELEMSEKVNPFDYIKALSYTKENVIDTLGIEEYIPFLANLAFALHKDSILYANDMNMRPGIDKELNWSYYYNGLPKRQRFAEWPKKRKEIANDDVIVIMELYNINRTNAELYAGLISDNDMNKLREFKKGLE